MKTAAFLKTSLLAAAISMLTACGGGSESTGSGSSGTPAGSTVGTLTDSPIGGVAYQTSSGISGFTDASGHFNYKPGDTVTFTIGELTLGSVTANGSGATITPLQIAQAAGGSEAEQANLVSNLLVLLQSLDSDGDASDGITIPASAATALSAATAATLDLTAAPAVFAGSIGGVVSAAGGELVDAEDALAHFKEQFLKDLAGVHLFSDSSSGEVIAFRINADGSYLMGEVAMADADGQSGIERGRIDWNAATGEIAATVSLDTNGKWGLSHISNERLYFSLQGGNLHVVVKPEGEEPQELLFTRIKPGSGVAGAWVGDGDTEEATNANALDRQQFIFNRIGTVDYYLMLDPVGDVFCGSPGLELGRYTLSGGVLTTSQIIADTNGCAGLHDYGLYTQFTNVVVGSNTISLQEDTNSYTMRRISTVPDLAFTGTAHASNNAAVGEVHESGLDVFCGHEYEDGETLPIKIMLNPGAGTFRLRWVGGDADDYFDGSYNAQTGALSMASSDGPRATGSEGFLNKSEVSFSGTYNAALREISGSWEETISTIWTGRQPNPVASCTSIVSFDVSMP